MGTSERRQRDRTALRRLILDAASRLFVEEGYQGVTMRRIAERIEYSPTTIYLHFKDKNELLAAVCDETFSELAGRFERLRRSASSPLGYLREALRAYVDFGIAHPAQYAVTLMNPGPGLQGTIFEHSISGRAFDLLRQAVRTCAERGEIQTPDADMTAQALWAAVHGLTSLVIAMPGVPFAATPALVEHAIDLLIAGLRQPSTAPRSPVQPQSKKWDYFA